MAQDREFLFFFFSGAKTADGDKGRVGVICQSGAVLLLAEATSATTMAGAVNVCVSRLSPSRSRTHQIPMFHGLWR